MRKERRFSQEAWSEEKGSANILRELGRRVLSRLLACGFITCNKCFPEFVRLPDHEISSVLE